MFNHGQRAANTKGKTMKAFLDRLLQHPKTSLAGLCSGLLVVVGVLSQQGVTLGHVGTGTGLALVGALAAAATGALAKD